MIIVRYRREKKTITSWALTLDAQRPSYDPAEAHHLRHRAIQNVVSNVTVRHSSDE